MCQYYNSPIVVGVAQLVELLVVVQAVVGSIPIVHPNLTPLFDPRLRMRVRTVHMAKNVCLAIENGI